MSMAGCAQVKTLSATRATSPPNCVGAWGPRAIGLSFLVMLGFVAAAAATSRQMPRLLDLTVSGGRVAFIQPDGTPTILELATGTVVQRGGKPPAGWPAQSRCDLEERKPPVCTFGAGTFTLRLDSGGERFLEGRTEVGSWEAPLCDLHRGGRLYLWAVEGSLLVETSTFYGAAMLEGIDLRSGRALWVYLYPPASGALSSEAVREARADLGEAVNWARDWAREFDVGAVVLDPDPWQARKVERTSARAWTMLCAAVIASLLSFLTPRGAIRTTFAFAGVGAVGILIAAYGNIDGALAIRLWIGFLITVWIGAAATSRPRSRNVLWLLVVGTAVLFALPDIMSRLAR